MTPHDESQSSPSLNLASFDRRDTRGFSPARCSETLLTRAKAVNVCIAFIFEHHAVAGDPSRRHFQSGCLIHFNMNFSSYFTAR